MNKKTWTITVLVILVALTSVAIYSNYKANKIEIPTQRDQAIKDSVERPDVTINVKHQYKDGTHLYLGTFETPTPCYSYNAEIIKEENERIISLTYSEPATDQICSQVVTEREFSVSFEGEDSESVIARLNGDLVNLNIFEVPDSQNINDFQIFIKG
jgi:hypothetical protein